MIPGRAAPVTVSLTGDGPSSATERSVGPDVSLEAPSAVRVMSQAIWFPGTHELMWRLIPETPGNFELRVHVDGATCTKSIQVGDQSARRSPLRSAAALVNQLLDPSEPPLPAGGRVPGIRDRGELPAQASLVGLHWAVVYLALCFVFAGY